VSHPYILNTSSKYDHAQGFSEYTSHIIIRLDLQNFHLTLILEFVGMEKFRRNMISHISSNIACYYFFINNDRGICGVKSTRLWDVTSHP
jgi:hypothetical protein